MPVPTPPASRGEKPTRGARRRMRRSLIAVAGAALAATALTGAMSASAAPPAFPNNVVVFPDRDFVTIEGYQDHIGQDALVEVTRNGQVIGSAVGTVQEGDVAFEINHPGGYCWGAGTGLNVTPDIRPNDKVEISFGGIPAGDTIAGDAYVTKSAYIPVGKPNTLVVEGYVSPDLNRAQMEQRIINPDLVDTEIGKRDIRAVPGPLTPAPKGGYSSALTFEGDTYTATYVFQDPANATIASKSGGERTMYWQVEDADANRQGLTIAEFGEPGGPGMGGCPAGPGDLGAPKPGGASFVRDPTNKTQMTVKWTPANPVPGAPAVTGYSVEAVQQTPAPNGEKVVVGKRTLADGLKSVVLTGLAATEGYDVEIRSIAGETMSAPYTVQAATPSDLGDTTPPSLIVTPGDTAAVNVSSTITLASEVGADIYYTLDGSPAIEGGMPSDKALRYTDPIAISVARTLHAVAFDRAGNFKTFTADYQPPPDSNPVPSAITAITGTAGQAAVTLSWASNEAGVTGFEVNAYVNDVKVKTVPGITAKTVTINSLSPGTEYYFTVRAKNPSGFGPESTPYGPLVPTKVTDTVSIGTAKWKSGDFRVTGTGSLVGAIVIVRPATSTGAIDRTRSLGTAQLVPAAPPAVGGTFDIRLRNANAPATNPGKIYVESDSGGVAGPFVVSNG
jgi:fibronectin type III domain protein/Fn3 domain-containing protein